MKLYGLRYYYHDQYETSDKVLPYVFTSIKARDEFLASDKMQNSASYITGFDFAVNPTQSV